MDRVRRVLAHLLATFYPIRPLLTGTTGALRGNALPILVMLILCTLTQTAMREVANDWVEHSILETARLSHPSELVNFFCKAAREHPDESTRAMCLTAFSWFPRQVSIYDSVGDIAKFYAAAVVVVILYLWTSARLASRSTASPGRTAAVMMRRDTICACLAAAVILLVPALVLDLAKIARGLLLDLWMIGPLNLSPGAQAVVRDGLSAVWLFIAAPFALPILPLALMSSRGSPLAGAVRLGWNRYLQFAALAAATAGPFIGAAAIANWSIRVSVVEFLFSDLHLGDFSRIFFDMVLTTLALVAVVAIAAAFIVAAGPRTGDAR